MPVLSGSSHLGVPLHYVLTIVFFLASTVSFGPFSPRTEEELGPLLGNAFGRQKSRGLGRKRKVSGHDTDNATAS